MGSALNKPVAYPWSTKSQPMNGHSSVLGIVNIPSSIKWRALPMAKGSRKFSLRPDFSRHTTKSSSVNNKVWPMLRVAPSRTPGKMNDKGLVDDVRQHGPDGQKPVVDQLGYKVQSSTGDSFVRRLRGRRMN